MSDADWTANVNKMRRLLKAKGVDVGQLLRDMDEGTLTTEQATHAATAAQRIHPHGSWADMIAEVWRAGILTGLTTQVVNPASNFAHMAWHYLIERPIEALLGSTFLRGKGGAQLGELRYLLRGLAPSAIRHALHAGWRSWRTEQSYLEAELGREGISKMEKHRPAITGPGLWGAAGHLIRWPFRMLNGFDQFDKTLIFGMEVGAQA